MYEILQQVAPFRTTSEEVAQRLARLFERRVTASGATLYRADDEGDELLILIRGEVELEDTTLATLASETRARVSEPGTMFSRASLLGAFRHRHTLRALSEVEVGALSRERFEKALAEGNPAARHLLAHVTTVSIEELSQLNRAIHALLPQPPAPPEASEC